MSEYQYYEFQALDRPLNESEKTYIESLSSRVQLTSTKAVFTYSYGDFRGDPETVLEKCFDVMLYMANWGSRQLMFRLPRSLVNPTIFEPYCLPDSISVSTTKNYLILDINICDEDNVDWIDGEGLLSAMIPLREDLLLGDFRVLYLAWLKAAPMQMDEDEDEDEEDLQEPPVPANLYPLSTSLQAFAEFFAIDDDLIEAAAEVSPISKKTADSIEQWIPQLSEEERNNFLVSVVRGEPHVKLQLVKKLEELSNSQKTSSKSNVSRRSLSQLLALAEAQRDRRQEQERQAAQQAKIKKLEALAKREITVWEEVFRLIALKQAKPYDEAVAYLVDLHDLAEYQGKLEPFNARIEQMQDDYSNRPGLLSRLRQKGLLKN